MIQPKPDLCVYLSSPYTHSDPSVMEWRYRQNVKVMCALMNQPGVRVFSPIVLSHPTAGLLPNDHEFWMEKDLPWVREADLFVLLALDGWKESKGVERELQEAKLYGVPWTLLYYEETMAHGMLVIRSEENKP